MEQISWELLTKQQKRNKWAVSYKSLKVGDYVLIKGETTPPSRWLTGRVIDTFSGPDGLERSCKVQTKTGIVDRTMTKLCLLPIDTDKVKASEAGFCLPE